MLQSLVINFSDLLSLLYSLQTLRKYEERFVH